MQKHQIQSPETREVCNELWVYTRHHLKHFTQFDIVVPQLQAVIYTMFYFHLTIIPKKQLMFAKAVRTAKNESHNEVNGSKLITDISCN